jgi:hypothetical protein
MKDRTKFNDRFTRATVRLKKIRSFQSHILAYLSVNIFLLVVWTFETTIAEIFWTRTFFITGAVGALGVLAHGILLFSAGYLLPKDWEQQKTNELANKENLKLTINTAMDTSFEEQKRLERVRKRVESIKGFYKHFAVYLLVNIVALVYSWFRLESGEEFFTLGNFSMTIFWGIGVVFHAAGVFGSNIFLSSNWEDRKIRELMEKEQSKGTKWE